MKTPSWTGLVLVMSLLLSATSIPGGGSLTGSAPAAVAPDGDIDSLSGSNVVFDPTGGYPPHVCFTAESFTADWEYVYSLWLEFPEDWVVDNVTLSGTPSCDGGGSWGTFSWSFETSPYEITISHPRYQAAADHCVATYCVDLSQAPMSSYVEISWYWSGDGYGSAPHHPCSSDGYTPPSMAGHPCDEAVLPPAFIPPWCCAPYWYPWTLETSGCNGVPQWHQLELHNGYWEPLTFEMSYAIVEGQGTVSGPPTIALDAFDMIPVDAQLTPDLCAVPGSQVVAEITAAALDQTWTATIVKTVVDDGSCPSCSDRGWLAGRVTDAESGGDAAPCTPAAVTLEPGGQVLPVDRVSGLYGPVGLVAQPYTTVATAPGYDTQTAAVTVTEGLTTTQDFELARPGIAAGPPALSAAAPPGVAVTKTLAITNTGHLPLSFEIVTLTGSGMAPGGRQPPAAIGIDPLIARHMALAPNGKVPVFVAFRDTADLSAAATIPDKTARVRAVRTALRRAADRAQANVRAWLHWQDVVYQVFAIDNTLLVEVDRALVTALAAWPGVSGLRANHTYPLMAARAGPPSLPNQDTSWALINMGVPAVWQAGYTGQGAIVAGVDTGVAYQHEALFSSYLCGNGPHADCWLDPEWGTIVPYDSLGHGTMMMSQMTGDNDPGLDLTLGVAPGAGWISCLGCRNGSCTDYALNVCADWLLMGTPYTPDVIDHAWGTSASVCDGWYSSKLYAYHSAGILAIFAAGDDGPQCNTDQSPANDPLAFAVGASTPEDIQAYFSGTGPGSCAGKVQYPDVVAPGIGLCAADMDGGYGCDLSGTCLASALTAGCAALVKSAAPQLSGAAIADVLRSTAYSVLDTSCGSPQPDPNYRWGHGRVDCLAAVSSVVDLGLPWVWVEPVSGTVPAQAGLPVSVTFQCTPAMAGQILTGTLRIEHGDPCSAPLEIPVELVCIDEAVPDVEIEPSSIDAAVCPGSTDSTTLSVCNVGTASLAWTVEEEEPPTAWLDESPLSGALEPDDCQEVEVTLDAVALAPGEYAATLHVLSNDPDQPDVALPVSLTVPAPPGGASFDWAPAEPVVGETVLFSGTVEAGDPPLTFAWWFGDGGTGSGPTVAHAYAASGAYTVTLGVTNPCGQVQTEEVVTVRAVHSIVYVPVIVRSPAGRGIGAQTRRPSMRETR